MDETALARAFLLAHGAGSTADFVERAFRTCGLPVSGVEDRTGRRGAVTGALVAAARRTPGPLLLGGVSIGAHAAVLALPRCPPGLVRGLVLVMPAWTGPAPRSSPTAAAAREVAESGATAVLERLSSDPELADDWVTRELRSAWAARPSLAGELAAASRSAAPSEAQLARITCPVLVLALADDPFHPAAVARRWAAAIPGGSLDVVPRHAPAADLGVFGRRVRRWLSGLR